MIGFQWYVARSKPMAEYITRDRLEMDGFDVFLPCIRSRHPRRGHEDQPLFPGYIFVYCDLDPSRWTLLRRLPHPVSLVTFGGIAPAVPNEVIEELAQRVQSINGGGGAWTSFRHGDRVRVSSGPFETLAQVAYETNSPRQRVRVLMEFMGRMVSAEVPWWEVTPVLGHEPSSTYPVRRPRRTRGRGRWVKGHGSRLDEEPLPVAAGLDSGRPLS